MIALGFVTNIFQRGAASMGASTTFSRPSRRLRTPFAVNGNAQPEIRGAIEMRHLTFAYPTDQAGETAAPAKAAPFRRKSGRPTERRQLCR